MTEHGKERLSATITDVLFLALCRTSENCLKKDVSAHVTSLPQLEIPRSPVRTKRRNTGPALSMPPGVVWRWPNSLRGLKINKPSRPSISNLPSTPVLLLLRRPCIKLSKTQSCCPETHCATYSELVLPSDARLRRAREGPQCFFVT